METSLELRNFTKQNMIVVIAATMKAEIEFFQRSLLLRLLESGFHMIAAITELFFLSDCSDHSDRSDHMETRL